MQSHRLLLLGILLALLVGSTGFADGWPTDNRVGIWLRGRPGLEDYQLLQTHFHGDESVLLRLTWPSQNKEQALDWARELGPKLQKYPSVALVLDPFRLPGASPMPSPSALDDAAQRHLVTALNLMDAERRRLDFLLQLNPAGSQESRHLLAADLKSLQAKANRLEFDLAIAGHPLVAASLDQESKKVEAVFAPALALIAALGVWALLRSLPVALLALLPALLGTSLLRATYRAVGWDANLILVSAGPLMLVILLASSLHLASTYLRLLREGQMPEQAASNAFREKRMAGLLAGLTTSTGFLVFLSSPLEPVRRLGLGVGLGVLLMVPAVYIVLPRLLPLVRRAPVGWHSGNTGLRLADFAQWCSRRRLVLLALGGAILVGGIGAFAALDVNTNALRYFPEGDRLKQDFAAIEADGTGLTTLEILLRQNSEEPWEPTSPLFHDVKQLLLEVPGQLGLFGPEDVLKDLAGQPGIAALPKSPRKLLTTTALELSDRLSSQGEWAHWTLRMASGGSDQVLAVEAEARNRIEPFAQNHQLTAVLTGTMPLMLSLQDDLIGTLLRSLGLTLVATFLFFLLVTRDWKQRVSVLVVNLVPVSGSMVAAYLLGYELDGASVMVAAVVLSLAVDNTFHLMHAYQECEHGLGGLRLVFARVGPPAAIAAIALGIGFASLGLSGFAPTARFGLLTSIGILLSLPADLALLPSLLSPTERTTT